MLQETGCGTGLQVFVVDAALFSLHYDMHFCRALAAAGVDVSLIGRNLRSTERLLEPSFRFEPWFYPLTERGDTRPSAAIKALKGLEHGRGLRSLAARIARERPSVVHFQWLALPPFDQLFLRYVKRYSRLVMTVHNSEAFHGSRHASRLQVMGEHQALMQFDHYIAHTNKTCAHLQAIGIEQSRIHLLPHPPISIGHSDRSAAKVDGRVRVLFFGSIKAYKGVDLLVQAGIDLARRRDDFCIEIAGQPFMDVSDMLRDIDKAGFNDRFDMDLRFLPDEDLHTCLERADLVVFPYRSIDASGAFALAVEHGVPIIATDVGVFSEEASRDYLTLVPPGDPGALTAALEKAVGSAEVREDMRRKTMALRQASFSWGDFARKAVHIYRAMTASDAPAG